MYTVNDLILTEEQTAYFNTPSTLHVFNSPPNPTDKWPEGKIYYQLDSDFTVAEIRRIERGFYLISDETCLRFVKWNYQPDYVSVVRGPDCSSHLGRVGGKQEIWLGDGCVTPGIVAHEFLHAAGVEHQHQRWDRDDHIQIHFERIPKKWHFYFTKLNDPELRTYGVEYNVESIMHYPASYPGLWTNAITSFEGHQKTMDQRKYLTEEDAQLVDAMYDSLE